MKINQISAFTYQNKPRNSEKTYNSTLNYQSLTHSVPFKSKLGEFASDVKQGAKVVIKKVDNGLRKAYDSFFELIESEPVRKTTKNVYEPKPPVAAQGRRFNVLEPEFAINYEKILTKLENPAKVDARWVKENKEILKTMPNYDTSANMGDTYYTIVSRMINDNRKGWIKSVKEFQASEHANYIKSIEKEFIDIDPSTNKEKSLMGLKALQKYGSREDLKTLERNYYDISKDNEIMSEYAKFVEKVGEIDDYSYLIANVNEEMLEIYNEKTYEEIMKTLKKLMVDKKITDGKPEEYFVNFGYPKYKDFEKFSQKFEKNPVIRENAQAIMRRIEEYNPEYNPKHIS